MNPTKANPQEPKDSDQLPEFDGAGQYVVILDMMAGLSMRVTPNIPDGPTYGTVKHLPTTTPLLRNVDRLLEHDGWKRTSTLLETAPGFCVGGVRPIHGDPIAPFLPTDQPEHEHIAVIGYEHHGLVVTVFPNNPRATRVAPTRRIAGYDSPDVNLDADAKLAEAGWERTGDWHHDNLDTWAAPVTRTT